LYPEVSADKVYISKKRLQELEALEARVLAEETHRDEPAVATWIDPCSPLASPEIETNPLLRGLADLSISPTGKRQYVGISSSLALGLRLRDIVTTFRPDEGNLDLEREHSVYDPSALKPRRHSIHTNLRLPPQPFALHLFAAQYTYIGTIFAFVSKETFKARLLKAYQGPPDLGDREACLAYAEVLIILAFGQMYSVNQWNGFEGPPGFQFFSHALQYMPDIHEDGSVLFVEVLALCGYFMQNLGRRDAAFLYLGVALRMAVSLALHQEVSAPLLSDMAKEHRRRLFWSVYSLDRILCAKAGMPINILDEDIGVAFPSVVAGETDQGPAVVLRHYTELSRILGRIMKTIYRKTRKSGTTLMLSVQSIMSSLATWHRDLPDFLRFDPERLSTSRESVSTLLHYHQCINMTARPLLFHVVQQRLEAGLLEKEQDWRHNLSQTTIAVIEACIVTARNTISMMTIASQKDLVATYGYFDGEHLFGAAAVLVMVCVAFPYDSRDVAAMESAMNLLRTMADRGNTHIGSLHQLLLRLASLNTPCSDAAMASNAVWSTHAVNQLVPSNDLHFQMEMPDFATMNDAELQEMFSFDANLDDIGLWEAGYTDADVNMEQEMSHWRHTVAQQPFSQDAHRSASNT